MPGDDRDHVYLDYARSICPVCYQLIDGQMLVTDNKVILKKNRKYQSNVCPSEGILFFKEKKAIPEIGQAVPEATVVLVSVVQVVAGIRPSPPAAC